MALSVWDALFPMASANVAGINAARGNKKYPGIVDATLGEYGYSYDPREEEGILSSWFAQRQQDLDKNSNVNQLNQVYGSLTDEANAAAAASAQTNMDQARMYGATTGQLERAINQKGLNQLNVTADIGKQKAQDLWGAQMRDTEARRALEDKNMSGKLAIAQAKQSSWGRQGGLFS